jgi:hypothetical protein
MGDCYRDVIGVNPKLKDRFLNKIKPLCDNLRVFALRTFVIIASREGSAPPPSTVREMANLLLEKRGTTPVVSVSDKWVYNFVN